MGRHEHARVGVGDHPAAKLHPALVGSQEPGNQRQQRGFAAAIGPQHGEYLPVGQGQIECDVALVHPGLHAQAAHASPAMRRPPAVITTTAATTMSSSDSAIAAWGSVSRCR